jgi:hypothetical protein
VVDRSERVGNDATRPGDNTNHCKDPTRERSREESRTRESDEPLRTGEYRPYSTVNGVMPHVPSLLTHPSNGDARRKNQDPDPLRRTAHRDRSEVIRAVSQRRTRWNVHHPIGRPSRCGDCLRRAGPLCSAAQVPWPGLRTLEKSGASREDGIPCELARGRKSFGDCSFGFRQSASQAGDEWTT